MIWLDEKALYNPAGQGWPVVRIDGALWQVLTGGHGLTAESFSARA